MNTLFDYRNGYDGAGSSDQTLVSGELEPSQAARLIGVAYGVAAACLVPLAALSSAPAWQLGLSSLIGAASAYVWTQVKSDPLAAPQLGACASSGRAWRLRAAWRSQEEAGPLRRLRPHHSMVKVTPWQCPRSAPAPPHGAPGSSGWLGAPTGETGPLGAQPLPRVLELAASEAADVPASDHAGGAPRRDASARHDALRPEP